MTVKQQAEVILRILIIFLSALFILSIVNGGITLFIVIGALSVTYLFLHYWEKRFLSKQHKKVKVK